MVIRVFSCLQNVYKIKKEKKRVRIMRDKGRKNEGRELRKKQHGGSEENMRGK